jgi:hypothetical protein
MAAAASTMSLLPISQPRKQQQQGAGAVVVFQRRPWDARRRRYVVPVRDSHPIPSRLARSCSFLCSGF